MKLSGYKKIWKDLNARNFGGVLVMPDMKLSRNRRQHGAYNHQYMIFAKNPNCYWIAKETVYHEMVHQYICEFLGREDYHYHRGIFRKTYSKFWTNDINPDRGLLCIKKFTFTI
jgi:hypothetical protein